MSSSEQSRAHEIICSRLSDERWVVLCRTKKDPFSRPLIPPNNGISLPYESPTVQLGLVTENTLGRQRWRGGSERGDESKDGVAWWNRCSGTTWGVQREREREKPTACVDYFGELNVFCFAPSKNRLEKPTITIKLKRIEPNILTGQEPFLLLY